MALNGHLEVVSMDETTCISAAANGHLDVLKWARENGCPWGEPPIVLVT